ncbi:MAG TPA: SdrD B-like domain-containing protein [Herpetosiphonaceae bacterium]
MPRPRIFRSLIRLLLVVLTALSLTLPASTRAVEVPPTGSLTYIQTNGPAAGLTKGDWYTDAGTGNGQHYVEINVPAGWPAGTPVNIDLFSPEINTTQLTLSDESETNATYSNTTFEMYAAGTVIGPGNNTPAPGSGILLINYPSRTAAENWVRFYTIPAPVTPGNYVLRSQARDDDQNGWRLRVGSDNDTNPNNTPPANYDNPDGVEGTNDEVSIGVRRISFQHDVNTAGVGQCLTLYEYVAPGQASIAFHNFDLDGNQRVRYYAPSAAYDPSGTTGGIAGTLSVDSSWNTSGTSTRGTGDVINNPEPGWWKIVTCVGNHNQYIQEGQFSLASYYEQPPTPVMTVSKTDNLTITGPNNVQTYVLTFDNTSESTAQPGAALNVVLTDTIPTNTTYLSCAIDAPFTGTCSQAGGVVTFTLSGNVNAGVSGSVRVTVRVNSTATSGTVVNNVTLNYRDGLGNQMPPVSASDTDTIGTGTIGNFVWNDLNRNGIQDAGEPGLPNVTVQLYNSANTLIATTLSDASGAYAFTTVPAGNYYVRFLAPNGYNVTPQDQGGNDNLDSDADANGQTATFAMAIGQVRNEIDAGLYRPAIVGDTVYLDVDRDGIQDTGEPGIANVQVRLCNTTPCTTPVATALTDAQGHYLFFGVLPGTYYVDVVDASVPTGLVTTIGTTDPSASFTVVSGGSYLNIDFGYINSSTTAGIIGDLIWSDADGDGLQDPGEPGIGGVTVALRGPGADGVLGTGDDTTVATATTAADGSYRFTNVVPGEYIVAVTDTGARLTGYTLTSGAQSSSNPSAPITVAPGGVYLNADFGYRNTALYTVSDVVWFDSDGDGTRDAGEAGIPLVTFNLVDSNGVVIATTISDASGAFSFAGVPNGSYTIRVAGTDNNPAGYVGTTASAIAGQRAVTVNNANVSGVNFGYNLPGLIGDTVFNDADGDGAQDPNERGLPGVTVVLWRDANGDGIFDSNVDTRVATTATDADGQYRFTNQPAGTYFVSIDNTQAALTGYTGTTTDQETGANAAGTQIQVGLAANASFLGADFGYRNTALADISGAIWNDLDVDGRDDGAGEPQISGVTVALIDASGNVIATTTTNASGAYSFNDLPAGSYSVKVTDSAGILDGYGLTSGFDPYPVTIVGTTSVTNVDFGYVRAPRTGSIGDFVWFDADRDGVQDAAEGGLPGVRVVLKTPGADGVRGTADDVTIATTTTDPSGRYVFEGLAANTLYFVDVDQTSLPSGLTTTTGTSDPSNLINLSPGEFFDRADFGYRPTTGSAIGDRVWFDADGDMVQDPGEAGIAGVQITVTGPSGTFNVTTNASGFWLVPGLTPGNYTVTVNTATLPAGTNTTPTNGAASRTFAVVAGQNILYADFGFNGGTPGSIGDRVWFDGDGDGTQDAGEDGIPGVTLSLLGPGADNTFGTADDVVLATTTTNASGQYSFIGLRAGSYRVSVTDENRVLGGLNLSGGTNPTATIALAAGQTYTTADFGYTGSGGSIGNSVWRDLNGNGVQEAGEPGIAGVTLNLYRDVDGDGVLDPGVDNLIRTVTTDSNGNYEFTGLPAGRYLVDVVGGQSVLSGFTKTSGTGGSDKHSQADPYAVNLSGNNVTADFGYRATTAYTISGLVFKDANNNSTFDTGDTRFPNIEMRLYRDLDGDGVLDPGEPLIATTISSGTDGSYIFTDLPNGHYIVAANANNSSLAGTYQTTQRTTNSVQPVFINNASSINNNFGFFANDAPTLVDLISFTARRSGENVVVCWETATEYNTQGFYLYRSADGSRSSAVRVTPELIFAEGSGVTGAVYTWTDSAVQPGATYTYWLHEVETGGATHEYGPASVTIPVSGTAPYAIFVPLAGS